MVNLVTPEEWQELADGVKLRELRPRIAARILKEAYDQGGVLPFSTVGFRPGSTQGLLTGLHSPRSPQPFDYAQGKLWGVRGGSQAVALFYEQNPSTELRTGPAVVLPHSGTIFDMGRTLTHKRAAVLLKHQGLLEQEIARRIDHHPSAVARYNPVLSVAEVNDDERVGQLWEEGKSAEMISFITGLSMKVVQEYIAIRQELRQEAKGET